MLEMLLSVIGGGLGGLMRLAPEILKFFSSKDDRKHELAMLEKQIELDKMKHGQTMDLEQQKAEIAMLTGEMSGLLEALKGQESVIGVAWIDGLNKLVRPVVTYWWMFLLTMHKVLLVTIAWKGGWEKVNAAIWTTQDFGILSMILGFWFVDRAMKWKTSTR